jgi:hypothetical protein
MELQNFVETKTNVSFVSLRNYKSQYAKLFKLLGGDMPIASFSEKQIIKAVKTLSNPNGQQALLNIGIQVLRMSGVEPAELTTLRDNNKVKIKDLTKLKNVELAATLPSYNDLLAHIDSLFNSNNWTDYVINYLLVNFQVRNKDLLFDIVLKKKDMVDTTKNYMWWNRSLKKIVYIRNNYKTVGTYGVKENTITDPNFILAIKRIMAHQKANDLAGVFIPNESQLGYYICKASFNKICEGKTVKIVINHFRNNIDKLKEISNNRGTSVDTLLSNYDIEFQ